MKVKYFLRFSYFILFFILLIVQTSCEKFSGDQTVPSYLKIDSIRLVTDYSSQGSASHAITDAWVYVDGQLIGAFQLPATIPVLKEGNHALVVQAGIKKDGIAATRVAYPFYEEITKTVNLTPDKILDIGILTTSYSSKTVFIWKEDFDNAAITLDSTAAATVKISQTPPGSPLTFEGIHSGIVEMDTVGSTFSCVTHSMFTISSTSGVYLELNFNMSASMTIGVDLYDASSTYITNAPIITLNPTDNKWKKIYIDLSTALNTYNYEKYYKVYFSFINTTGQQYRILLDNIKLVSF